ncbi:MAG: hypothetical protein C5B51_06665, partial [Terriglobia bacterium]
MTFVEDARYAWRLWRKEPGFTAIVLLTLALGIGANTAIFSIFDAVLLRPLPYREPQQLVSILERQIHAGGRGLNFDLYSDYENWKKNSRAFEGFAAVTWAGGLARILKGQGPARTISAMPVTADFFSLLGVAPALGRTFEPEDAGRGCSVVLSHQFWQGWKGAQENVIGQVLRLDDQACTIAGVMPANFASYPNPPSLVWLLMPPPPRPDRFGVFVMARIK